MYNENYPVNMGNSYATLYIVLFDKYTNPFILFKMSHNRLARRFVNKMPVACKVAIFQKLYSQFNMKDIEFDDF